MNLTNLFIWLLVCGGPFLVLGFVAWIGFKKKHYGWAAIICLFLVGGSILPALNATGEYVDRFLKVEVGTGQDPFDPATALDPGQQELVEQAIRGGILNVLWTAVGFWGLTCLNVPMLIAMTIMKLQKALHKRNKLLGA